ncbi:MAG: DUF1702 family protein [Planctomycetes bacterium]|nr:DUF1702 family protein [Planctomycetota bacterium]
MGILRGWIFRISPNETTFARRGFPPCPQAQREHLEKVGHSFVEGYRCALSNDVSPELVFELDRIGADLRGFAYEGAAMALALLDLLTPWRRDRIARFLHGPGDRHIYMIHVGVGFALAKLRRGVERSMQSMHPFYRWLVIDGYGFHEGFFKWRDSFEQLRTPVRLTTEHLPVFDQGLGRSLWFVSGAQPGHIVDMIGRFPRERQHNLWSGIGLASTYAGGVDQTVLELLRNAAADTGADADLAQGAAFAAKARERAGNILPHTEMACETYCGRSARAAAMKTDESLKKISSTGVESSRIATYENWRQLVRDSVVSHYGSGTTRQTCFSPVSA